MGTNTNTIRGRNYLNNLNIKYKLFTSPWENVESNTNLLAKCFVDSQIMAHPGLLGCGHLKVAQKVVPGGELEGTGDGPGAQHGDPPSGHRSHAGRGAVAGGAGAGGAVGAGAGAAGASAAGAGGGNVGDAG